MTERTLTQNAALHLYFRMLADKLNESGLDMKKVLKPSIDIPWTEESVKTHLWKPVQQVMIEKASTTKLSKMDVSDVYEVLNRHLAEKLGVFLPFPHEDER